MRALAVVTIAVLIAGSVPLEGAAQEAFEVVVVRGGEVWRVTGSGDGEIDEVIVREDPRPAPRARTEPEPAPPLTYQVSLVVTNLSYPANPIGFAPMHQRFAPRVARSRFGLRGKR